MPARSSTPPGLSSDNLRGAFYLCLAMLAVTTLEALVKATNGALPVLQLIAIRSIMTTAIMFPLLMFLGNLAWPRQARDRWLLVSRGVVEFIGASTYLGALYTMPIIDAKAIYQSVPLVLTLGGYFLFAEKVGWRRLSSTLVGFAGVILIIKPGSGVFDITAILVLVSVFFMAARDLITRKLSADVTSSTAAFSAAVMMTVLSCATVPFVDWQPLTPRLWLIILALSVVLVLAYLFLVQAMRQGEVSFVAPFRYTGLLWAVLFGLFVFGERPDLTTWLGAAIVVAAGLFTLLREQRVAPKPSSPGEGV